MNRNVPTLLGIVIILLVAILVIGVYNLLEYRQLAAGNVVVGTRAHETLTGQQPPAEVMQPPASPVAKPEPLRGKVGATSGR